MREDSVVEYRNPGIALPVADALTEVLRQGARELLQQAVEGEVAEFPPNTGPTSGPRIRLNQLSLQCGCERRRPVGVSLALASWRWSSS